MLLYLSLIITYFIVIINGNTFCMKSIASNVIYTRFEGKMNVPIKPAEEPHDVLFLWPGVNPYGGEGGLMQPVITYGANYGQGNEVWGIANWFSDCPGYCHDPYQEVDEGDTILFYMQYIETYKNGSQHWEMGWSSYNTPNKGSKFQVYREGKSPQSIWATEAEFYLNASDPSNYKKLPLSYYYTWDMVAMTKNNGNITSFEWTTHNEDPQPGNFVNCSWSNNYFNKATQLTFAPYNNGCSNGYSRDWNQACQKECGCNNNDGTKKIECDYCCLSDNGQCKKQSGPSISKGKHNVKSDKNHDDRDLPHPGFSLL